MRINPSKIRLDAATVCQLKCPTCPTSEGEIAKNLGSKLLKFEDFKKLVDANPWIRDIELSSRGEIFLNHDLLKIMAYAHEKKIGLSAANGTNMNTVSEEVLEGLVKYQFNLIICAIDGASNETYKIYRRGGDFNRVIANIKKINAFKAQYRSSLPKLLWQFIPFGHNEHEVLTALRMARELGMEFCIKLAWGDFSPVRNKALIEKVSGIGAASRDDYQEKNRKIYLVESLCSQLWRQPQINADGRVLGCCVNYWADYGNAFQENLAEILNSERMNYARAMLLGKKEERADIPCTQCLWYKKMKKEDLWLFSRKESQVPCC